jgi:hypothetical protein
VSLFAMRFCLRVIALLRRHHAERGGDGCEFLRLVIVGADDSKSAVKRFATLLIASNVDALSAERLQPSDQVAIAAIDRRMVRMRSFVEPGRAFVLMAARPAPVNGTTGDGRVIRHNFQLPVDAHLLHHASHQGGSSVNPDQIVEKTHVVTLLR